ncbi:MAG: hypothetical protein GQ545_00505 [Candidatus Aminicenantes bacterium]|jgi:hypothetical protein|nr:hypothetical protein [Candidatus Aminicenantes bacterium]
MKISHKDLKGLYKSYLEDRLPVSRAKCPSPQDITACLRGEGLKNRRNRIIDHIFQCAYCHEEFEFILKTIREEKKFIHDLSSITKEKKHREKNKFFYQLLPLHPAWMYGLIFITGVVMISLLVKNISEERKYRGTESRSVTLITPNKKTTLKTQLEFEWKHVQNSDYFILEIFDESLYPIWKSDKITVNHTLLSEEITNRLLKQKTYYWMVTAFLSDGKTIESRLQDLVISD